MHSNLSFGLCSCRGTFSIYVHHGGTLLNSGGTRVYLGNELAGRHGFEEDMFGYFDLKGELEDIGYESWKHIYYRDPSTEAFVEIIDDHSVLDMITHLSAKCKICQVYVDGGRKKGEVDVEGDEDTVGGDSTASNLKGKCVVEEVAIDDSSGKSDYSNDDEGGGNEENQEVDDGEHLQDVLGSEREDEEYLEAIQNLRQEQQIGIDDILSGKGKAAENGENHGGDGTSGLDVARIIKDDVGSDELVDDYVCEDEIMEDTSSDDGNSLIRKRHRVFYDPKCDHKQMKVVLGMRFEDGIQCRKALRTWAIVQGHPIHFSRCSKELNVLNHVFRGVMAVWTTLRKHLPLLR